MVQQENSLPNSAQQKTLPSLAQENSGVPMENNQTQITSKSNKNTNQTPNKPAAKKR